MKMKSVLAKPKQSSAKANQKGNISLNMSNIEMAPESGRSLMRAVHKYNTELTKLVGAIFVAEAKSDKRSLSMAKQIVKNWKEYFEALSIVIKKECESKKPSTKLTLDYLKVQISFLEVVDKELDCMIR